MNRDQRCRVVNKDYERWFGIPRSRIAGMSVKELLGAGPYGLVMEHVTAVLRGEAVSFEGEMHPAGGVRRCFPAE
ncbi:MAG TPA: PAS domain-containing protein [Syntrophobacteraceae bacterium]|nr:PAS domain-containing protein [Syntrophobacteraceae bacterium]